MLYNWYQRNGTVYHFIFRCNHLVTNIQYRELVELLRIHTKQDDLLLPVEFMNKQQVKKYLQEFLEEFPDALKKSYFPKYEKQKLYEAYKKKLYHTIIIQSYSTSCIVWIPNFLTVNLAAVCRDSGYIFTCGKHVFHRNVDEADYENLEQAVGEFLENQAINARLIVYDEREFSFGKKGYEDDYNENGMQSIQIESNRSYFKNISVSEAAKRLCKTLDLEEGIFPGYNNGGNESILWLYKEYAIPVNEYGNDCMYYNCIHQLWVNENPCYLFDTDHPAWNNTLIPHTFAGAMLNIARAEVLMQGKKEICILDPLVGSGTICLEALKYPETLFRGADISRLTEQMVNDNLAFFSMDYKNVKDLVAFLSFYLKKFYPDKYEIMLQTIGENRKQEILRLANETKVNPKCELLAKAIGNLSHFLRKVLTENTSFYEKYFEIAKQEIMEKATEMFEQQNLKILEEEQKRFCFYIQFFLYQYRKAYLSRMESYNAPENFRLESAVYKNLKDMLFRMLAFMHLRYCSEKSFLEPWNNAKVINGTVYFYGKYALSSTFSYKKEVLSYKGRCFIKKETDIYDFLKMHQSPNKKVDIIITDPPYGFNTDQPAEKLYYVYNTFIKESIKCLNNGGQIVLCLLSKTHQGKRVHGFTKKDFVIRMFEEAAWENKMYMIEDTGYLKELGRDFVFPFYWESKKVLRREVIRLQFFNLENGK